MVIAPKYLQVTSQNRYVLIAERDVSQKSGKSVQLKGVCHQRAINSSFKYVVSDFYPVDIYQNFEMIFKISVLIILMGLIDDRHMSVSGL